MSQLRVLRRRRSAAQIVSPNDLLTLGNVLQRLGIVAPDSYHAIDVIARAALTYALAHPSIPKPHK